VANEISEVVGQAVRRRRTELEWTLARLAKELKERGYPLSVSALSRLEAGERGVSIDHAVALADALGVQITSLLARDDHDTAAELVWLMNNWNAASGEVTRAEYELFEAEGKVERMRALVASLEQQAADWLEEASVPRKRVVAEVRVRFGAQAGRDADRLLKAAKR
jgi:transcriptional regulator with XRE-family HTH domain